MKNKEQEIKTMWMFELIEQAKKQKYKWMILSAVLAVLNVLQFLKK